MIPYQRSFIRSFSQLRFFNKSSVLPSKNEDKEEGISSNTEPNQKKEEVSTKLNDLLQSMIEKENNAPKKEVNLAKAAKHKREKIPKEKPLEEKLAGAAKDVATSLGGDVEKTESELLSILLRKTDSGTEALQDVLKGILVQKKEQPESRAQQVRDSLAYQERRTDKLSVSGEMKRVPYRKKPAAHVNILGAKPSIYFKDFQPQPAQCELTTWNACVSKELKLAVTHPPANIYEQMVQWTDRGMLWRFPINNEQGLDEEQKVGFEEHIFLEEHLVGWCPEKGPVRHFMELVCVGLSKNHWLTAEEKKTHIYWYKDYFTEKKDLLAEIGAGNISMEKAEQGGKELSK